MTEPDAISAAQLLGRLRRGLTEHDRASLVTPALAAVHSGALDIPTLYTSVLSPLLSEVGERWHEGDLPVWEEHFATASVTTIVEALYPTVRELAGGAARAGSLTVLATPTDELHVVGLRMVSDLFELAGWDVVFLGANVPEAEIYDAVLELRAQALVMSASTSYERVQLLHIADRLHEELPGVRIWVGGHAFAEEHESWPDDEILDLGQIERAARTECGGDVVKSSADRADDATVGAADADTDAAEDA